MIAYDARRYASRHPMAKVIQQLFEKENKEMDLILQEEEKEAQRHEEDLQYEQDQIKKQEEKNQRMEELKQDNPDQFFIF